MMRVVFLIWWLESESIYFSRTFGNSWLGSPE